MRAGGHRTADRDDRPALPVGGEMGAGAACPMSVLPRDARSAILEDQQRCLAEELALARKQLRLTRLRLLESDRRVQDLLASNSWQATEIARRLGRHFPALARAGVRLGKLATWAALGELSARARSRRLTRHRLAQAPEPPEPAPPSPELTAASLAPRPPTPGERTILIVDASIPCPDRHAGARTTAAFIAAFLEAGWSVVFAPFDRLDAGDYTRALSAQGVLVVDGRTIGGIGAWLAAHGPALDHVMLMRPRPAIALLQLVLERTDARISYYGHDLHFARLRAEAALARDIDLGEIAERELAIERQIWRTVDVILYPSATEAAAVAAMVPGVTATAVMAMAFDQFPAVRAAAKTATLLFVGNFAHAPNQDAAIWFAGTVFPRVRAVRGDARFMIAGSGPTPPVLALAGDGIEVTGYLTDEALQRCYEEARVAVVPLRFGAGVKGKVVEALRNGVPVVTTHVGAEGIPGLADIVPVHDEPAAMAAAILRLMADDAAWGAQAEAEIAYARAHFSRAALRGALLGALEPQAAEVGAALRVP